MIYVHYHTSLTVAGIFDSGNEGQSLHLVFPIVMKTLQNRGPQTERSTLLNLGKENTVRNSTSQRSTVLIMT